MTHRSDDDETAGATGATDDGDDQARRNGDAACHQVPQPLLHPDVQKTLCVTEKQQGKHFIKASSEILLGLAQLTWVFEKRKECESQFGLSDKRANKGTTSAYWLV